MDRKDRPVGREKKVGYGTGEVERRGEGLGRGAEGPVGNSSGYADRPQNNSAQSGSMPSGFTPPTNNNSGSNNNGPFGGYPSGGKTQSPSGMGKIITYLIIAAVIIFFLYQLFGKSSANKPGTNSPTANHQSTTSVDRGEYAVTSTVSPLARKKLTTLRGMGRDQVTIMVYLCGSDLESKEGAATADLQEMMYAEISEKVNIIIETGGTFTWQNKTISSKSNQRYRLTSAGIELLQDNLGKRSMGNPITLGDFIRYSKENYPADRYMLLMWDHGGGSLEGFGYDQFFQNDSLTVSEMSKALNRGGCQFDLIGFDACLMANLETAVAVEPFADYMIASEDLEPSFGWNYTGWLSALSKNTSIPTIDLGKKIIDDYLKDVSIKDKNVQATLSLVDLAELNGTVPSSLSTFASSTSQLIDNKQFKEVSDARAEAKEFAVSSNINQIDVVHFAQLIDNEESKNFAKTIRDCIKYNRGTPNITNANGLSIFFPYDQLPMVSPMLDTYEAIGMGDDYSRCIKDFASVTAGGQITSGGNNMLESLLSSVSGNTPKPSSGGVGTALIQKLIKEFLAKGDFSSITGLLGNSLGWLDTNKIQSLIGYFTDNRVDKDTIKITEKDGQRVLALSEKQWDIIQHMEQNVFIDDGKGFIDLGLDNVYEYNDDGDLIMEFDGTWLSLNGNIVSYYMLSEDRNGENYTIKGRIPAMQNNELVDIMVMFTDEEPDGVVLGAQLIYDPLKQTKTIAKGLQEIKAGDKIDFLCDYYTYQGKYNDTYFLGKSYTASGKWKIENLSLGKRRYQMTYRITDIYNNQYWTPSVSN